LVPVNPSLYRSVIASGSCFSTSTRRCWPLTSSVISRSTEPGSDDSFWPMIVVRNRYADAYTVAPAAITPLMKVRRE
jgi:hypothetical protein